MTDVLLYLAAMAIGPLAVFWLWPRIKYIAGVTTHDPTAEQAELVAEADRIRKAWGTDTPPTLTPPPMSNEVARWRVYNLTNPDHGSESDQ
jgi:hypothetical protein